VALGNFSGQQCKASMLLSLTWATIAQIPAFVDFIRGTDSSSRRAASRSFRRGLRSGSVMNWAPPVRKFDAPVTDKTLRSRDGKATKSSGAARQYCTTGYTGATEYRRIALMVCRAPGSFSERG